MHLINVIKKMIVPILLGIICTVLFYSTSIFFSGVELFLFPIFLIIFLIGVSGIVIIPIAIYKVYKRKELKRFGYWLIGIALGFYLGLLMQKPIDTWDRLERNKSGEYITNQIETYHVQKGYYPDSLAQLNLSVDSLGRLYQIDRFGYMNHDTIFNLYLPIPIMNRWEWNKVNKEFEYVDF